MFPIPFANTISKPRTMMIISGNTLFTHATMPSSQWHINKTLSTIPQTNFYFSSSLASLNSIQILFMFRSIFLIKDIN